MWSSMGKDLKFFDTQINNREEYRNTSFGAVDTLCFGKVNNKDVRRGLIKLGFSKGFLPQNAEIISASMFFQMLKILY